ncbi:MAG: hypothetical protein NC408_05435 [Candidatus Gastranaerophilales bacterium]|nr:hypothetical protein [Candidatus Gastranaerophilales bacterium]MCM1073165.1 hypothetical protein [Bacteroides sp.]
MKSLLYLALVILSAIEAAMIAFPAASGKHDLFTVFLCGIILGMSLVGFKLNMKNNKLDSYKRELEKESIAADENSARVKVLEQKIEVLEKALDNALNG